MMAQPMENARPDFLERHYSLMELSEAWNVSPATLRRWFKHEPDVVRFGKGRRGSKRPYYSMRVPESVALRVYRLNTYQSAPGHGLEGCK